MKINQVNLFRRENGSQNRLTIPPTKENGFTLRLTTQNTLKTRNCTSFPTSVLLDSTCGRYAHFAMLKTKCDQEFYSAISAIKIGHDNKKELIFKIT